MISPQQEIYNKVMEICIGLTPNTYGFLPYEEVDYPMVYVGEQFSFDEPNKTAVFGRTTQAIHVYHNDPYSRWEVSEMMNSILAKLREAKATYNYSIHILNSQQRMFAEKVENSKQELLHGVLELEFHFSFKGGK